MTKKVIEIYKLEDQIFVKELKFEQKIYTDIFRLTSIEIESDVALPRFFYNPNIGSIEYFSELSEYRFDKEKNKHYQKLLLNKKTMPYTWELMELRNCKTTIEEDNKKKNILNENELEFIKNNVLPNEHFNDDRIEFEKKDYSSILDQNIKIIFTSKNIKQYFMDENNKEVMSNWAYSN